MEDPKHISMTKTTAAAQKKSFWKHTWLSFRFAWKGIKFVFKTQANMWVHSVAAVLAILLSVILHISRFEWLIILLCICLVMALEIVNTAIEVLADQLHPDWDPKIGLVKDLAAAAVLIAAVFSFIIGCCIFGPALTRLIS